jgi:hypothetical protein
MGFKFLFLRQRKGYKKISLADNDKAIDELKVQPLSSLVPPVGVLALSCSWRSPYGLG